MGFTPIAWADVNILASRRQAAVGLAQRIASQGTQADLITRDFTPTDLMMGVDTATFNTGALASPGINNDVFARPNFTLSSTQALVIWGFGLESTNPQLREMQWGVKAGLFDIISLTILLTEQRPIGVIDPPIAYKPSEHVVVNFRAAAAVAAAGEEINILAVLAEQGESNVLPPRTVDTLGG